MPFRFFLIILTLLAVNVTACAKRPAITAQSIEDDEDHFGIRSYLYSKMEAYQGDLSGSLESLQQSLVADPDSLYLQTQLATLYAEQGRFGKAKQAIQEVLAVDPNYKAALLLSGKVAAREQRLKDAAAAFRHVIRINPRASDVRIMLAEVELVQKKYSAALRELRALEQVDPEFLNVYYFEGLIYTIHLKDYRRAIKAYKKILIYEPTNFKVLATISELYLKMDNTRKAVEYLRRIQQYAPTDVSVRLKIALIYYKAEDFLQAADEFLEIQSLHPEADKITYYLGVIYENTEQYDQAADEFIKIGKSSTFYRDARMHLAMIYEEQGDRPQAIVLIAETIKQFPHEPLLYEYLVDLYSRDENWEESVTVLQRAIRKTSDKEKFNYSLGVVLDIMGDETGAIKAMKKVLKINPENPNALNFIGYIYAEQGRDLNEAEEMILDAMQLKPKDGYITDSLGWVYYQRGDYDRALVLLERANQLVKDEPTVLEHLGDVNLQLGHKRAARNYYRRAIKIRRNNPDMVKNDETIAILEEKLSDLDS